MSKGLLDVVKEWRESEALPSSAYWHDSKRTSADEAQPFVDKLLALERNMTMDAAKGWTACQRYAPELHAILHGEQVEGGGSETMSAILTPAKDARELEQRLRVLYSRLYEGEVEKEILLDLLEVMITQVTQLADGEQPLIQGEGRET